MPIDLIYKHQQKTYELMKKSLETNGEAAYVFPTGCGKSFPALKYIEENPDKKVVIITPSLEINNQFKRYVREYMEDGEKRLKNKDISTITYQKILYLEPQNIKMKKIKKVKFKKVKIKPDVVIVDEGHRWGGNDFERALDAWIERFPEAEKIGMSATPERTDKRNMLYEKFGDNVVYEMTLAEALSGEKEGEVVLKTPRYIRVLSELREHIGEYATKIDSLEDEEKKKRLFKSYKKMEEILDKAPGIDEVMLAGMKKKNGKYLIFCKDRIDLQEKMEKAQEIFGKVNSKINMQYVLSKSRKEDNFGKTPKQNRKTIEEFENKENGKELNLLFCVDMLNEGVHIDNIDGEVLFDLTESKILFSQRIGRVLSSDKEQGETVIIDASNNWLNQIETYLEIEKAIQGGGKVGNYGKDYDLLRLSPEETELLSILREFDEEFSYKPHDTYSETIQWLKLHDGKLPRGTIGKNAKILSREEMTPEEQEEVNLYHRWLASLERKVLGKYAGEPIENVPEEYQKRISELRGFGLGQKKTTNYDKVIEWLEKHNGRLPRSSVMKNGKMLTRREMTKEEQEETKLYQRWARTEEKEILEIYAGKPIEDIPEEYRDRISKLRSFGLGEKIKTPYEEMVEWLDEHASETPRGSIKRDGEILLVEEMTEKERYEVNLNVRWRRSPERKILDEYAGKPLENVPEEYREKISILRAHGLGVKQNKTAYEETIEWLEEHNGKMPRVHVRINGKPLSRGEMTEEEQEETKLYQRWARTPERKLLDEYAGEPIESVPEEYRKKIAALRAFGLGIKKKTVHEEIVEWLEEHEGAFPKSVITKQGKELHRADMTEEERKEVVLRQKWNKSEEKKILDSYEGQPIEVLPEEYRDKIEQIRELRNLEKNRTTKALSKIKKSVAKFAGENENTRRDLGVTKDLKRIDGQMRT